MTVDAIVGQLVGHDPTCSVVDQNVQPIGTTCNLIGCFQGLLPVREITLQPYDLLCSFVSQFLSNSRDGTIDHILGNGEDEKFFNALRKHRVRAAVSYAFGASSDHGHFSLEGWDLLQRKLLTLRHQVMGRTPNIFRDCFLDCVHGRIICSNSWLLKYTEREAERG